jgi:DNA-binding transcriptional ArsR family regulator
MNGSDLHETLARPVLACLGVSSRFRLVRALAAADRCVGELAEEIGLSQSCTTRHLQALERVGLVKGHREGRRVRFRLRAEAPGLGELLGWALSGAAPEALRIGPAHPADRSAPMGDGRPAGPRPTKPARQSRRTGTPPPRARTDSLPRGESGSHDSDGREDTRAKAVAGPRPARRPDDLEDYLL